MSLPGDRHDRQPGSCRRSPRSPRRGSSAPRGPTARHARRRARRWGPTPAAGYTAAAAAIPDESALIDELGTLTFSEVHERTNALAHALADEGIGPGDGVAIMCRNHRGLIDDRGRLLQARGPRAVPQHRVLRARSWPTCSSARTRGARLRRGVRGAAGRGRRRPQALHRLARARRRARRPDARGADRGRRRLRPRAARARARR